MPERAQDTAGGHRGCCGRSSPPRPGVLSVLLLGPGGGPAGREHQEHGAAEVGTGQHRALTWDFLRDPLGTHLSKHSWSGSGVKALGSENKDISGVDTVLGEERGKHMLCFPKDGRSEALAQ